MAYLNFYLNRISYLDGTSANNPQQRCFDLTTKREGLEVNSPLSISRIVMPGQTMLLDSSARTIAANLSGSQFTVSYPSVVNSNVARIRYTGTGTAPAFRTLRAIGSDATTVVDVTEVSDTAVKFTSVSGTPFDFVTGGVMAGDELYLQPSDDAFTNPFNAYSLDQRFQIIDFTATSVTIRTTGAISAETGIALGANFDSALRVFSSAGVQVGDKLAISQGSGFNTENKSRILEVYQVTDRDIIVVNNLAVPETISAGVNTPFSFYDRLINFLVIEATGPIKLRFNGGQEDLQLVEHSLGQAFFAGSVNLTSVYAVNSTSNPITVNLQSCTL